MCRVHLSDDGEMLDLPIYVMNSDNEQALMGMDILSLGEFSATRHQSNDGQQWLRFKFYLYDNDWLV